MPDINVAYLEMRLSGGSANTDPNASLGGDASSERILSQSAAVQGGPNITGVTIDYAGGNPTGIGTLSYVNSAKTLQWQPYGLNAGVAVNVPNDGRFAIFGEEGVLMVTVTYASLPGSDQSDSITIANIANEVWDDVSKAESFSGDTEYRCYYLKNVHNVDPFLAVSAYIITQPTPGTIAIGVDPAGPGDGVSKLVTGGNNITRSGSTATVHYVGHGYTTGQKIRVWGCDQAEYNGYWTITVTGVDDFTYTVTGTPVSPATGTIYIGRGVAVSVANESTAPSGVTFSSPTTSGTALNLGQIAINEVAALWVRRVIGVKNTTSNTETISKLALPAYY